MAEISRIVETQMTTMLKSYLQASGLSENASALEFTEDVTKSVSSSILQGCQVEKTEIIGGRVFVMAVYDFEEAKLKAKQAIEPWGTDAKYLVSLADFITNRDR